MRTKLQNKIPVQGKRVWQIYGSTYALLALLVVVGGGVITYFTDGPVWIYAVLLFIWAIFASMFVVVFPTIRHKVWRYEVREKEIEIQSGLFVVKNTLIPMVRVQHVDTAQGPILKRYNLADISISSAATTHTIPFLFVDDADALRAKISELARVAEEDV